MPEPNLPFRWDLRRDQLGTLVDGTPEPDLWFADELITCAARIVARSDDGDIRFVGRSLDSVFDLLGGAFAETSWRDRLAQLPFSLSWGLDEVTRSEVEQLRANLLEVGVSPSGLARRRRPLVFVDLVSQGGTFENLYLLLRDWIDEERAPWGVVRRTLRFVGVTSRTKTSPKTWRWQQDAPWTADLPARAIKNVSLSGSVWSYLGNHQNKITASFSRARWSAEWLRTPPRNDDARAALAEAVALLEFGRARETRVALARAMSCEHAFAQSWLRSLAIELRR